MGKGTGKGKGKGDNIMEGQQYHDALEVIDGLLHEATAAHTLGFHGFCNPYDIMEYMHMQTRARAHTRHGTLCMTRKEGRTE